MIFFKKGRLKREEQTMEKMIKIYCRINHNQKELCEDCSSLLDYARKRLKYCPFGLDKPTCVNCKVHCYIKEKREKVREVMRFSGPKMLTRHPYLAIMHLIDGRK